MPTAEVAGLHRGLEGAKVSWTPETIAMQAHSVLRFLQTNCEKDGATYVLSKDANSDELCLYEVTKFKLFLYEVPHV